MQDESPAVSSSRPWTAETTQTALPTPTSPLTHAIFLSTLIIPFAVLPYLAITRHLRGLQATATEVQATTAAMQRELRTTLLENAIRKDEQAHLRRSVEATGAELRELRVRLEKARLAQAAGESTVTVLERRMLQEREWRSRHMVLMRDVGGSLADIAAFMHEMELRHGLQPKRRGIEKIRQLALKLQDSSRLTEEIPITSKATPPPAEDSDDEL